MGDESRKGTGAEGQGDGPDACVPGLAEDIEQMFRQVIRERDEARARVAALERQLARRSPVSPGHGVPTIDLERVEVDPAFIEIIPAETARKHRVIPLCVARVFAVAMADPSDQEAIDEISTRTGFLVQPVAATDEALDAALDDYYGRPGSSGGAARVDSRGNLRLVWSRQDPRRAGGSSDGGRPAA